MCMGNTNDWWHKLYYLGDEQIPHDTEEKDLGVYITENSKSIPAVCCSCKQGNEQIENN